MTCLGPAVVYSPHGPTTYLNRAAAVLMTSRSSFYSLKTLRICAAFQNKARSRTKQVIDVLGLSNRFNDELRSHTSYSLCVFLVYGAVS